LWVLLDRIKSTRFDFFWRRIHQIAGFVEMGDAQIKVIVKYGAQNINVEVPATGKVEDLMQQLQLHTQLLPRLQKLICKGKVLKGDMSLKTAQLTDGAKVMLMAAQGFQPRVPTVCLPPAVSLSASQIAYFVFMIYLSNSFQGITIKRQEVWIAVFVN
jgi:hypothetical protein